MLQNCYFTKEALNSIAEKSQITCSPLQTPGKEVLYGCENISLCLPEMKWPMESGAII